MVVRVEPVRCSFPKLAEEFLPTTAFRYIAADVGGLILVSYDQVMGTGMQGGPGKSRARLFVLEFSMNDRRDSVSGVTLDVFPDVKDRTAGRVDDDATFFGQDV